MGGTPFVPSVSGRAGVGMFSRLHLVVTFDGFVFVVLFPFALCVVARHITYLFSAAGGVVVACLVLAFCFFLCSTFRRPCSTPSVCALFYSFTLLVPP